MRWILAVSAIITAAVQSAGLPLAERLPYSAMGHPAIQYAKAPTSTIVDDLAKRIADGIAHLHFDERTGYLKSVLAELHINEASQMLVTSKTGVQALYTEPKNPRALYFNDVASVGYIHGAPLLEFAVQDPAQGTIFYVLEQRQQEQPAITRRPSCLVCHNDYTTVHVPGLVARSGGNNVQDHRTPFGERWAAWYVTGTAGMMTHRGTPSVEGAFDATNYLSTQSDIVALMVFEHQMRMMNLITRVGWEARMALHDHQFDPINGTARDDVNELVDYLLFKDEVPLTSSVKGTTTFAKDFSARGPVDHRGRSLYQLDLERRLLKFPCSYMIYSPAFHALPGPLQTAIYRRVIEVLGHREGGADILEILRDTLTDFPKT
jgi:hypothetical protein